MSTPDIPLLRKIVEHAEDEFRRFGDASDKTKAGDWYQNAWFTTTTKGIRKKSYSLGQKKLDGWTEKVWMRALDMTQVESCGTTGCIAGHACLINGDAPAVYSSEMDQAMGYHLETLSWEHVVTPEGKVMDAFDRAREILGLTMEQAESLFEYGNTIEQVRAFAEEIAESVGETL